MRFLGFAALVSTIVLWNLTYQTRTDFRHEVELQNQRYAAMLCSREFRNINTECKILQGERP